MRILMIGGTGTISTAISRRLADVGHDLYIINRGNKNDNQLCGGHKNTLNYVLLHKECQTEDEEFDKWCGKVIAALENAKKEIV